MGWEGRARADRIPSPRGSGFQARPRWASAPKQLFYLKKKKKLMNKTFLLLMIKT